MLPRSGPANPDEVVDGTRPEAKLPHGDFAVHPRAQLAALDGAVELDGALHRPDSREHRVSSGTFAWDARQITVVGARSPRIDRESLRRIGATSLRCTGELRWIANEQRPLGIEQRHLRDALRKPSRRPGVSKTSTSSCGGFARSRQARTA